jgi:hypothetical protein
MREVGVGKEKRENEVQDPAGPKGRVPMVDARRMGNETEDPSCTGKIKKNKENNGCVRAIGVRRTAYRDAFFWYFCLCLPSQLIVGMRLGEF